MIGILRGIERGAIRAFIAMIRIYQRWISPLLGEHCRFHPTCSEYAVEAFKRHGALRGGGFAVWRICRCHPWSSGGVDLVPTKTPESQGSKNE